MLKPFLMQKNKYLSLLIRIAVSAALIGYFLYAIAKKYGGLDSALIEISSAFTGASLPWLIPAALLHVVGFSLVSLRWKILLDAQGIGSSYRQLFTLYFMAAFFNTVLPSTIGGDTVRALESKKLTGDTTTSVMVVIIERLTGLMALVLIASSALLVKFLQGGGKHILIGIFLFAVTVGFGFAFLTVHPITSPPILRFLNRLLPEKLFAFFKQAHNAATVYYRKPASLFSALGISLVFQLNMVLYYFLLARALGQQPEPLDFMVKIPIMIFLLMTVPAINGLGVRTASFTEMMKLPAANAMTMEFIDLGLRIFYGLLGGLMYLFYRHQGAFSKNRPPDP